MENYNTDSRRKFSSSHIVTDTGDFKIQIQEFSNETTFHGMRYVFSSKSSMLKRILWCCFVLGMIWLEFIFKFHYFIFSLFLNYTFRFSQHQIFENLKFALIT